MRVVWIVLAVFFGSVAQAAPTSFVSLDRSVWPERLDSPVLFDVASRAQILSFAQVLHDSEGLDEQALADRLQLRQINLQSVRAVRARMWGRLWNNYQQALQSCDQDASFCFPAESLAELRTLAATFDTQVGAFYAGWVEPSRQFHVRYLDDLLRKAALLPRLESEVQRFLEPEDTGGTFGDRLFLLSVVGGPGLTDGATETLAHYLRQQQVSGLFFVLGSRWQQRRDATSAAALRERYADHCVGLQGWEYRSHAQWQDWQASLQRSQARIQSDAPQQYVGWFRRAAAPGWPGVHGGSSPAGFAVGHRCAGQRAAQCRAVGAARAQPDAALASGHRAVQRDVCQGAACGAATADAHRTERDRLGRLPGRFSGSTPAGERAGRRRQRANGRRTRGG